MNIDEVRDLCIERTWTRALKYLGEGRIKEIREMDDQILAKVQGSRMYEIYIEGNEHKCSCPYSGRGECKHIIAVLMKVHLDFDDEMCLNCASYENGKCMSMRPDEELIRERDRILYPTDHCMWFS